MGSFCKDLEQTKKSLEISKNLLNKSIEEEQRQIESLNKNDYLSIYKIKENNSLFQEIIKKTITDLYIKIKEKYKIKADSSIFPLYNIGPAIAKLLTAVEKEDYLYQVIDYKGTNYYQDYSGIGTIDYNGTCFVVSKKDFKQDDDKLVEDNNVGNFYQGKETVCLATCGFSLPPVVCEDKIRRIQKTHRFESFVQFYNSKDQKIVFIPGFTYVYDFIDMVIDKKISESKKILSMADYDELVNIFVNNYQKEDEMKLTRRDKDGK